MNVFFRSANNYDTEKASDESALICLDPSLTIQSQADDADINTIVRRFGLTGELPQDLRVPIEGDYDDVFDFQSAQNVLVKANEEFMRMPATVRARFMNDPAVFHDFAVNPDNLDDMVKLGLATPKPVPDNPAPVVAPE